MRILSKSFRSRLSPVLRTRAVWWILAFGALLIEVTGRRSRNDIDDGFGILALLALAALLELRRDAGASTQHPLHAAAQRLRQKVVGVLRRWADLEADLRREPPLPQALPREQVLPALALAAFGLGAFALAVTRPVALRSLFVDAFYLANLAVLAVVWIAGLGVGTLAVTVGLALVRDLEEQRQNAAFARRVPAWLLPGAIAAVVAFGFLLASPLTGLLLTAGAWAIAAALLLAPSGPKLEIAWRPREGGPRRGADWSRFLLVHLTLLALPPAAVALFAAGEAVALGWSAPILQTMPVTGFIAIALVWLGAGSALLLATKVAAMVVPARLADPSRPVKTSVWIEARSARDRIVARRAFEALGWESRFAPSARRPCDVPVRLVAEPRESGSTIRWPLELRAQDLADDRTLARLRRRDQIQRRRRFFRGVRKLLRAIPAAGLEEGEGVLFGPQHWFMPNLTVDEGRDRVSEDPLAARARSIGPSVASVMSIAARSHFHEVMRALEIDVIYLEKGVGRAAFTRVVRILFDVHDMHGPGRALDERDLVGLPGLRAVIHAFDFEEPFRSNVFPEPHYDGVGRARVLHLFRDRGEQKDEVDEPIETRDRPIPALLVC